MSITDKIITKITKEGSITLETFMEMALSDEQLGYYKNNNPFGKRGDFITSPEISQIFGELIGLWIVETWLNLGKPANFHLIELGAGRGTLQEDILRTMSQIPFFECNFQVHIVEINHTLKLMQADNLKDYGNITWYDNINQININAPVVVVSNEFFDALPIKQYNYVNEKWYELYVNINSEISKDGDSDNNSKLFFVNKQLPESYSKLMPKMKMESFTYESSPTALEIFEQLVAMVKANKGAILTIDYGYFEILGGNSFRGFKNHQVYYKQDILDNLDNMDLTANVNFKELQALVDDSMVVSCNTQREFLQQLGVEMRLNKLLSSNNDISVQNSLKQQVEMLVDDEKMGNMFKVMVVKNI